jgi:hypothetical protein
MTVIAEAIITVKKNGWEIPIRHEFKNTGDAQQWVKSWNASRMAILRGEVVFSPKMKRVYEELESSAARVLT